MTKAYKNQRHHSYKIAYFTCLLTLSNDMLSDKEYIFEPKQQELGNRRLDIGYGTPQVK